MYSISLIARTAKVSFPWSRLIVLYMEAYWDHCFLSVKSLRSRCVRRMYEVRFFGSLVNLSSRSLALSELSTLCIPFNVKSNGELGV